MELFYGPFFSAFITGIFFLICLEHKFSRNISITLSFLFAFSTLIWAYSNTSLNLLPAGLFLLLGYLFFKKFRNFKQNLFLLLSSASLGFAFLIRSDVILFILPLWFFLLITTLKQNTKITSIFFYSIPLLLSYLISKLMPFLVFSSSSTISDVPLGSEVSLFGSFLFRSSSELFVPMFGLLFAPGLGLFIFAPILLTIFFSFPDFFRKNKSDCILFLSFFALNLLFHVSVTPVWHGLVGWGPRYLVLMIPFLLLPLGASLEKRNKLFLISIIVVLGLMGIFFNLVYVIQDVSWFVWGSPGSDVGLYGIAFSTTPLYLHPNTIWTFQFSQLTHSILLAFEGLQHDIYLLHVLGTYVYVILFVSFFSTLLYFFLRIIRQKNFIPPSVN